jgi:hypothetical protein
VIRILEELTKENDFSWLTVGKMEGTVNEIKEMKILEKELPLIYFSGKIHK